MNWWRMSTISPEASSTVLEHLQDSSHYLNNKNKLDGRNNLNELGSVRVGLRLGAPVRSTTNTGFVGIERRRLGHILS